MTNEDQLEVSTVSGIINENLQLFNETAIDWVMTARYSLEFMKALPNNGNKSQFYDNYCEKETLFNQKQKLQTNFLKINLLSDHLLNLTTYLENLVN